MPQYPQQVIVNTSASKTTLNVTAPGTLVTAGPATISRINVIATGTVAGTVNDVALLGSAAVANQISAIPATIGSYPIEMPINSGLVVVPGTGQTVAVSWRKP